MAEELQDVALSGGSFDGLPARAPLPPRVLLLGVRKGDMSWLERYLYNGATDELDGATYPVMLFMQRDPAPEDRR